MANNGGRGRSRRLADKTIKPQPVRDPALHAADGCSDCVENDETVQITTADRVQIRMQLHNGRLVDFALIQQRLADGHGWLDVVTADCRHGVVHYHRHDAKGNRSSKQDVLPISTQVDIDVGYETASAMMFDEWEENLRRCTDGR